MSTRVPYWSNMQTLRCALSASVVNSPIESPLQIRTSRSNPSGHWSVPTASIAMLTPNGVALSRRPAAGPPLSRNSVCGPAGCSAEFGGRSLDAACPPQLLSVAAERQRGYLSLVVLQKGELPAAQGPLEAPIGRFE